MSKKKGKIQQQQDVPVDKLDAFFQNHWKTLIGAFGVVLSLFVVVYGVYSFMQSRENSRVELLGASESFGFFSREQVDSYSYLAGSIPALRDYMRLVAGQAYFRFGLKDEAVQELQTVGGNFKEFAQSLLYDINGDVNIDENLLKNGQFAPVWHYRTILAAPEGARSAQIERFRAEWPDSILLLQIEKWGLN